VAGRLTLQRGEVHLWRTRLDLPPPEVAELWVSLDDDERRRAERFHKAVDRDRFTVGRAQLRALLAQYIDVRPENIALVAGEHGKPRLRSPDFSWLRFNRSHSADVAVYAVAYGCDVGVDVEQIREDFAGDDVARRLFSASERASLAELQGRERTRAFFATWTLKEAYLKAVGTGLGGGGNDPEGAREQWSLAGFDAGPGYAAAVAVEGRGARIPATAQRLGPAAQRPG
jgi:4'-phosphopantetheinyl transferase